MIDDNRLLPLSPPHANLDRPLRDLAQPGTVPTAVPVAAVASEQAQLRDYIRIVLKRKWLILSVTLIVTSLVAIYMYRQPTIYEASATLQIDQRQRSYLKTAELNINTGNDPTYRNTQLKLLENPILLRQVILTLDLQNNPAFLGNSGRAGLLSAARRVFGRKAETRVGGDEGLAVIDESGAGAAPMNYQSEDGKLNLTREQLEQLQVYEDVMRAGLVIEPVEKTNLVDIHFQHTDPGIAANVANTLADVFIANHVRRETFGSQNQEAVLAKQITDLQLEIRNLQEQRINFMRNNDIPLTDMKGLNLTAERLETTSAQALEAEKVRKDLEASSRAAQRTSDILSIPVVQEDKTIQGMRDRISKLEEDRAALLVQYTEAYPAVQKVDEQIAQLRRDIDRTAQRAVAGLRSKYESALAKENQLKASYSQERGAANQQSQAEIMLSSLNQQLETSKQLFNTAYQRAKELEVTNSGNRGVNNITIQTPAREPREPVGPARGRNIILALLLSLGAGVGIAILLDNLDDTLKSIEDVDRHIHLPTLALIPAPRAERALLRGGKARAQGTELQPAGVMPHTALALIEDPRSTIAEAYRHLRTSLLLSSAGHPPKTVLVTSSQPSEGKTTTAVNTAVTLAQTGAQVLLLDCDLRRPRIHAHFGMTNAKGLTNCLAGEIGIDQAVQTYSKLPSTLR